MSVDNLKKALELLADGRGMVAVGWMDQADGWHMEIAARQEFAKRMAEAPEKDPMEVWCEVSREFSKRNLDAMIHKMKTQDAHVPMTWRPE